ncbi:bifunctional 4-hydroxy-3-methylbut-2-enyl diphosphate reductase/30S ribosomal protein S1 [Oscillibacter valericigenes]|uniref:bifunctional 4-hydroxy-3-methylbut-2-enyl diphosphate reductase/30S ribosomal protein S1 n=1 Tax=Oscillibacter valericigenes TaxID=351091 RepID=UPI001F30FD49|nr:bifunctional 4-hydroxy-3-methylbut-2-enyl diphosphate reductase/30S ribosomal protein S1 [Oscillibacter valericigenes]MCF2664002.1 bifunctional 4-hydroxy-3-methylbut-2-enyl diphosphate reductase/30S ribosomal protein S1 [Oscillibacter valericigenes]
MKVILAESAGFCYGVRRAVDLAEKTAVETGGCWMLGDLIHNSYVVEDLARRGIRKISDSSQLGSGDTVVIRSHGELKSVLDDLESRGVRCVNATCPNVCRIQKLVAQAEEEGRQPVIIGEPHHPEVIGIASWCRHPLVFEGPEAVKMWLEKDPKNREIPVTVVAQTTCIRELFETSWKILKKECTNAKIFDTICNATHKRQAEAASIAAEVDVMVVVGDRKSANTKHLTEICMKRCPRVLQIENADELSPDFFHGCSVAGLTAGASTPAGIIKEVYATMSEEIKVAEGMESFEELLNQSFKTLNTGEKVTGTVLAINPTEVLVDVGAKQYAYIKMSELTDDPNAKPEDIVKVGDEIETYIVRVNDVEGYAELSKKRLDAVKVWENIETAVEEKTVLEGTVTEENKGGIVVSVKGVRVFVPASQSGMPRGADLSEMKGQKVQLRITEVNRARRRVVGSIRSVTDEARKAAQEAVWSSIEVGKHYTGTVKSMTSYGVFVDIGGVDGMVHISELSWSRIKTPAEVCKVGDTMDVYVISFDPEKRKISLGCKDHSVDPWTNFMNKYSVGDVAEVRIVKLMTFGAFAEVVPGVDGLIHISQIADRRIEKPEDVLSEGQIVEAKITAVDEEKKKISLSIRALLAPAAEEAEEAPVEE